MGNFARTIKRIFFHQTALYWEKDGSNTYGKPTYVAGLPLVKSCRWEDKQQEIILPDGRKVLSRGFLVMIEPVLVGSLVMLGSLLDWQNSAYYPNPPTVLQGGREVLLVRQAPDYKNKSVIWEIYI